MRIALDEAKLAYDKCEVPIGAVIVCDDKIIAQAHNTRESTNQVVNHAEILAIQKANEVLNSWRLDRCTIYVTIEPCAMCSGAIIQSRMKKVVYGASDSKSGAHRSITNLFDQAFNHKVKVEYGILEEECKKILSDFFSELRIKK